MDIVIIDYNAGLSFKACGQSYPALRSHYAPCLIVLDQ